MSKKLSHHEALIYAMVTTSAVDRRMTDNEMKRIGEIVARLPIFRDFDEESLVPIAESCGRLLASTHGLEQALNAIKEGLPDKLKETAYAVAVEIAAADLEVSQEELRFLELLRDKLELDRLHTSAIERGARARHMVL
jgi:tellurite resistance protein